MKPFAYSFLLALVLSSSLASAQQVNLYFTDGNRESFDLQLIRKTTFSGNNLNLLLKDGTSYSWSLSSLDYYNYDDVSGTEPVLTSIGEVALFPNPSKGAPVVSFTLSKSTAVKWVLVNATGQILAAQDAGTLEAGNHQIQLKKNLPHLPAGHYTFRITTPRLQITRNFIAE